MALDGCNAAPRGRRRSTTDGTDVTDEDETFSLSRPLCIRVIRAIRGHFRLREHPLMSLSLEVVDSSSLSPSARRQVLDLCSEAYEEDFSEYLRLLGPGVHVLGWIDSILVSQAMWVTRWLQPGGRAALETAYVEAVATRAAYRRRGFASEILARLAVEIRAFDLGALSPTDAGFYQRLGWELWRGPLFVRTNEGLESTPDESVMILRLPRTPADLDSSESLSAEWRRGEVW